MLRATGLTGRISPKPVDVRVVKLKYNIPLIAATSFWCAENWVKAKGSSSERWLDVPGGPFALGVGELALGAGEAA